MTKLLLTTFYDFLASRQLKKRKKALKILTAYNAHYRTLLIAYMMRCFPTYVASSVICVFVCSTHEQAVQK